ncbi:serine hydrolase [Leucobacter manosquensis]|uniref:Serine hydrolase n=1 Tax=Leucobacter manosquensis TaxID=2810611 RepID=A0ABS5M368_9MICO|nr:serine hydrolase [Leucobacter manosquensis]MBS3181647.1 serine hydrolase [Leucobacter manosquensis]
MTPSLRLPRLDPRATWSIRVVDASTGDPLLEHDPDVQCETASIGKIFLLIEVARRIESAVLDPDESVEIPPHLAVADSGILYRMRAQRLGVEDLALLVGAYSDNLATNALIHLCGLDRVRAVAPALGYERTSLHDYIRDHRSPEMPWTPSFGTARELSDVMRRLDAGDVHSAAVSERVLGWLASNADTSMVADSFLLDPLAHVDAEYQGIVLRHKTGTTDFARVDVGHARGAAGSVSYAVAANWKGVRSDLRAPVLDAMRDIGEQIRLLVTGLPREEWKR